MRRMFARVALLCGLVLFAGSLCSPFAHAQTWNGGGSDNDWSTGANWSTDPNPPTNDGTADVAFAGSTRLTPNVDVPWSIHSLVFNSGAGAFTIGGSELTIGVGGITNNSTSSETINTAIVVGGAQTWASTSGILTLGGAITLNSNLTGNATNLILVQGDVSGAAGLIKTGTGVMTLLGTNSYTGGTTVSAGTLRGTTSSLQGPITNNATLVFDQTSDGVFSDVISGTGSLTKDGTGRVTLNQANTFTGGVKVTAGILQAGVSGALPGNVAYEITGGTLDLNDFDLTMSSLSGTGGTVDLGTATLTVNNSANSTYAGVITGTGSLVKSNTGTLLLSGANDYTGGTTVTGGTLQGDTTSLQGGNPATVIDVSAGASVAFSQDSDGTYSGVVTGSGSLIKGGTGNVTLSGANDYSGGTTVSAGTLTGTTVSLQGDIRDNAAVVFDQAADGTYSGAISGTGGVTKAGTGNVTFSGVNSYSGGTTISAGILTGTTTSLPGNIRDNARLVFDQAGDGTYTGIVSGTGALEKQGTGNVEITGANTYTGGTTVSGGTLTGTTTSLKGNILDNATLAFDQAGDGTYSGIISGTGALTKLGGGTVELSGASTYAGGTTVSDGVLNVNGSVAGNVFVTGSGTLGGTGTIAGNVDNEATVTPGSIASPIGTLNVGGTYTHESGATIQVNIDSSNNGSVLNATGPATINGGTVLVNSTTGSANAGQKFTFLTASSVTGTFDDAFAQNLPPFLMPILGYTSDTAFFTLLRNGETYQAVGNTFNERAVGGYLDQISPTASGDLQTVFDALNSIDDPELRIAESQMAGALHGTLGQIGVQNTTLIVGQVAQRLRSSAMTPTVDPCCCQSDCHPPICSGCLEHSLFAPVPPCGGSCWTGWAQGFGVGGSAKSDGNADGVSYGMGGVLAGVERWLDDSRLLGFYGGYVGSTVGTEAPRSVINGGHFGGYLYADDCFNYWTLMNGYEFDTYTTHRSIQFDDIDRLASANYNGWQAYVYAERGVSYESCGHLLQPFMALQYLFLRQNSFTERGADSIDLAANGVNTNSLRSLFGARLQWAWMHRTCRRSFPEIHAYWLHEYLDSHTLIDATFSPTPENGGTPFVAHGLDLGRDWAVAGASFTWEMHDCWSMFVNGDIQTNNQATLYIGSGGIGHIW